ncbi:MAG: single-stranded-DNA-specific exonuclease RecJ [Clostridiales Family XIII bacterium]|jgi:single-stranded-DNA-specific exonuclease|nr:single-stranded-DNA-specific exonuclease RecJ [Clostridiales Family XIII bacterium]
MGLHPIISELLRRRGICGQGDIEEFLAERPKLTYDPFLLKNMREGVDFILSAVRRGRNICVYGDYDADGVTSAALMTQALRALTDKVSWYIPSRFDEGYGLNKEALASIAASGGQVVVTVDCGSVSAEEVAYGQELGLEILVTDHHNIEGRAAGCLIINPKQEGETYPFPHLAGCGVAFKLVQALQRETGMPRGILSEALDLVAIATVADVVPLTGENRTIVKYGLRALNRTDRLGLRRLIRRAGLEGKEITSGNVAFVIAPHMNAAGRMGEAREVAEWLLTEDSEVAERVTEALVEQNALRKRVQEEVFELCRGIVEFEMEDDPIYVINAGDAHEGITGIVAGKLKERYNKPTLILTEARGDEGALKGAGTDGGAARGALLKGTGRSVPGIDIYKLLKKYERFFLKFGGHAMACGFLLRSEHEEEFRQGLIADVGAMAAANPTLLERGLEADAELRPQDMDAALINSLKLMEPFGNGNEAPVFVMRDLPLRGVAYMGDRGQHVRFNAGGAHCVLFRYAEDFADVLHDGARADLYGRPSADSWNGRERVQFIVERICPTAR